MNAAPFQVKSRIVNDVAVIYPKGYLNNLSGEGLVSECGRYIETGIKKIIVNFSETDLINSIGISLLLHVMEELQTTGGTLCFTDMDKVQLGIFDMLGLTKYFRFFQDEKGALQFLGGSAE
ncbi:putative Anti-anti-sigma factor [Candidatus Sulfobium mesophilum]|uniref:Putative Anti-anti-sigma factor n=1 Tax=Candidatus Sulfobium mesophilum TaxID=2016548 RepID=A0A2U3QJQ0_9BACT|nr:putative Anti-anti-sigma factor [Candidatus Sulfobium mesophilum]